MGGQATYGGSMPNSRSGAGLLVLALLSLLGVACAGPAEYFEVRQTRHVGDDVEDAGVSWIRRCSYPAREAVESEVVTLESGQVDRHRVRTKFDGDRFHFRAADGRYHGVGEVIQDAQGTGAELRTELADGTLLWGTVRYVDGGWTSRQHVRAADGSLQHELREAARPITAAEYERAVARQAGESGRSGE